MNEAVESPSGPQGWWSGSGQKQFRNKSELAAAIGTNRVSVRHWIAGDTFPRDEYCDKLFAMTGLDCFSPAERHEARVEHERLIPAEVKKARRAKYRANAELFRNRALASWRRRYERKRLRVSDEELAACKADIRKAFTIRGDHWVVCLECGEMVADLGPHLGPAHHMTAKVYKQKWGYNRGTALRSVSTNKKQSVSMKRSGHEPPREMRSRGFAPRAARSARKEEQLNRRGKRLAARPGHWKRMVDGDVVTDARIAQLRLAGKSVLEIAEAVGMTLAPVFNRLKRMGFPKRARVFLHGEPVGWKQFRALCADFHLSNEEAAKLLGVSADWTRRGLKPKRKIEALSPKLAKRFLKVRTGLLADYRRKPASSRGGRPRTLTSSAQTEISQKYDALRAELKVFRSWLRDNPTARRGATWNWLCEQFRRGAFRTLQFWPQFFAWIEKAFGTESFRSATWKPHELAVQFLADDYRSKDYVISHLLTHRPKELHQNGATLPNS